MDLKKFEKDYMEKQSDREMKFMMPLGWGWAFSFIKISTKCLIAVKVASNIPWLPFFMLCGVGIRLLLLPLMIKQNILVQHLAKVSPNFRLLAYCTIKSNLPLNKKAYYFIRASWKYSKDVKVNPLTFAAYNFLQFPAFFIMIMSIRKISYDEDLSNTGILWFKNLNDPDHFYILPIISLSLTYYNFCR